MCIHSNILLYEKKKSQLKQNLKEAYLFIFLYTNLLIIISYIQDKTQMGPKVKWTTDEEQFLKNLREQEKIQSWKEIAQIINQKFGTDVKNGKQCRERYVNYVRFRDQSAKLQSWTPQDDDVFLQLYLQNGPKWSIIVKLFPSKSENSLKNRFYGGLRRMVRKINFVEKQYRMKAEKSICYKSLVRIFQQDPFEKEGGGENDPVKLERREFLKNLRIKILMQSWKLLDGEQDDEAIMDTIKMIHQLNSQTKRKMKVVQEKGEKPDDNIQTKMVKNERMTRQQRILLNQVISNIDSLGISKNLTVAENVEILQNNLPKIIPLMENEIDGQEISENYSIPELFFSEEFYKIIFRQEDGPEFRIRNAWGEKLEYQFDQSS